MGFLQVVGKGLKCFKDVVSFCYYTHWALGSWITSLIGGLGLASIGWYLDNDLLLLTVGGFMSGSLVTFAIGYILYTKIECPKLLDQAKQTPGYRRISQEYIFRIDADVPGHLSSTITNRIEIVRPDVEIVRIRYLWTGGGRQEVNVLSAGHILLKPEVSQTGWSYHYILLGHNLLPKARIEVRVRVDIFDDDNHWDRVLAKTVSESVESLTLRAIFPRDRLPSRISNDVDSGPLPLGRPISSSPASCDPHTGECQFQIDSPEVGQLYAIRWTDWGG